MIRGLPGRLGVALLVSVICTVKGAAAATYDVTWQEVEEGLAQAKVIADLGDGSFFELNGVKIDPAAYRLEVVYVPDTVSRVDASPLQIPRAVSTPKKEEGATSPSPTLSVLGEIMVPFAAINGGFRQGSWSYLAPAGLLRVDGFTVQPVNRKSRSQTGVLCVVEDGLRLVPKATVEPSDCTSALQAGPFIVDPGGKIGISPTEPRRLAPFRRSFICIQETGAVILAVTTEVHLRYLAEMLVDPDDELGFQCERALNLSGDIESGLLVRSPETYAFTTFGETDVALASAVVVLRSDAMRSGVAGSMLGGVAGISPSLVEAEADDPFVEEGKDFFGEMIGKAFEIVEDKDLTTDEKSGQLLDLALDSFALDDISRFVLARYLNQFSEEDLARFKRIYAGWLIQEYVASLYESESAIEQFDEVGARRSQDNRLVLGTALTLKDADATTVRVNWLLVREDAFRIADVEVEGLSMVATHRSDFSRILFAEGPEGLLKRLESGMPDLSALEKK